MSLQNPAGLTMSIVAHPDDDLLFQNPDISSSIEAGGGHITVFVTAGDAGDDQDYWESREDGIKDAYSEMAGSDDWVDSITTFSDGEEEFEVRTAYLESQPDIRLYFLRLPDGNPSGSGYSVTDEQSLEKLWEGEIQNIESVDGANSYDSDQVVSLFLGLMEHHQPDAIMIQDHSSEYADSNHSDHVHSSQFAYEAQQHYSGDHQLLSYIEYSTRDFGSNLSPEQAAENFAIFQTYAEHDDRLSTETDADGNVILSSVYHNWSGSQYYVDNLPQHPHDHDEDDDHQDNFLTINWATLGNSGGGESGGSDSPTNGSLLDLIMSSNPSSHENHEEDEPVGLTVVDETNPASVQTPSLPNWINVLGVSGSNSVASSLNGMGIDTGGAWFAEAAGAAIPDSGGNIWGQPDTSGVGSLQSIFPNWNGAGAASRAPGDETDGTVELKATDGCYLGPGREVETSPSILPEDNSAEALMAALFSPMPAEAYEQPEEDLEAIELDML